MPSDAPNVDRIDLIALSQTQLLIRRLTWLVFGVGIAALIGVMFLNRNQNALLLGSIGTLVSAAASWLFIRDKRYATAVVAILAGILLTVSAVKLVLPEYTDAIRSTATYVILISIAGMLIGQGAGWTMAGLSILVVSLDTIIRAPHTQLIEPQWYWFDIVTYAVYFLIAALLSEFASRAIRQHLAALNDNRRALLDQNVSLQQEVRMRAEAEQALEGLVKGLRSIVASANELMTIESPDELWRRAVELARERLGIERCAIYLYEPATQTYHGTFGTDLNGHTTNERSNSYITPGGQYSQRREPFWQVDADLPYSYHYDGKEYLLDKRGWVVTTPIFTASGEPVALMYNDAAISGASLVESQQDLLTVYCSVLGGAAERLRLEQKLRHNAITEERSRLARELHDSVSQALYGISLGARTALERIRTRLPDETRPLEYVLDLSDGALAEMRALIFELRPESLARAGLVPALQKEIDAIRARHRMVVDADFGFEGHEPPLSLDGKETLYRIAVEAIRNTMKHAQANTLRMRLAAVNGMVTMLIEDDGVGFDVNKYVDGHYGLISMRERTERMSGQFCIESAPGRGTRLVVELPQESR